MLKDLRRSLMKKSKIWKSKYRFALKEHRSVRKRVLTVLPCNIAFYRPADTVNIATCRF